MQALSFPIIKLFYENAQEIIQSRLFVTQGMKHFVFVSHYKLNAGTEAALIRHELQSHYADDPGCSANMYETPIFLDSDDLVDLADLQDHVKRSHNLVLLLTEGVLLRPWVLVELVTAVKEKVRILPMQVFKQGTKFEFPSEEFIQELMKGKHLDQASLAILKSAEIELEELGPTLNHVFHKIAVPYSPHGASIVRKAQLSSLHRLCHLKDRNADGQKKEKERKDSEYGLGAVRQRTERPEYTTTANQFVMGTSSISMRGSNVFKGDRA